MTCKGYVYGHRVSLSCQGRPCSSCLIFLRGEHYRQLCAIRPSTYVIFNSQRCLEQLVTAAQPGYPGRWCRHFGKLSSYPSFSCTEVRSFHFLFYHLTVFGGNFHSWLRGRLEFVPTLGRRKQKSTSHSSE